MSRSSAMGIEIPAYMQSLWAHSCSEASLLAACMETDALNWFLNLEDEDKENPDDLPEALFEAFSTTVHCFKANWKESMIDDSKAMVKVSTNMEETFG